jgi:transposase
MVGKRRKKLAVEDGDGVAPEKRPRLEAVDCVSGGTSELTDCPSQNKRKLSDVDESASSSSLSPTPGRVLTLKDGVCRPFWGSSAKAWSGMLWTSTKTDLQDLDPKAWRKSIEFLPENAWFTVKVKKTTAADTPTLTQASRTVLGRIKDDVQQRIAKEEGMKVEAHKNKRRKIEEENERRQDKARDGPTDDDLDEVARQWERIMELNELLDRCKAGGDVGMKPVAIRGQITRCMNNIKRIEKSYQQLPVPPEVPKESTERLLRAKGVKIHPSDEEKAIIDQWLSASRFVYNKCVAHSQDVTMPSSKRDALNLFRDYVRINLMYQEKYSWLQCENATIVDNAVVDFVNAYFANVAKRIKRLKKGETFSFKMSFRKKKYLVQETVRVNARDWTQKRGTFAFLKDVSVSPKSFKVTKEQKDALPPTLDAELKITRTRLGHYFYHLVKETDLVHNEPNYDIIALDPGVRTFQTGYDTNGMVIEWGANDMKNVYAMLRHADLLQGKFTAMKAGPSKRRHRLAWLKMLRKVRSRITDLHRRLCLYLCRTYKVILLPEFGSKRMSNRATRKFGNKTARSMLTWGHYRFREMLKAKAQTYSGCTLIICEEFYTSKTCGRCGYIHHGLGSNKTFDCPRCHYHADRDVSAARNILIRFLAIFMTARESDGGHIRPSGFAHTSHGRRREELYLA